jgi:hypothetical protein
MIIVDMALIFILGNCAIIPPVTGGILSLLLTSIGFQFNLVGRIQLAGRYLPFSSLNFNFKPGH